MGQRYSGKQVIRAGEIFLKDPLEVTSEQVDSAMDVLSYWRQEHEIPLENALDILKEDTLKKDRDAIFAKRMKRFASIVAKLQRFDAMKLKNMQDIGGCRVIVSSQKKLYQIVRELKKRPNFKNGKLVKRYKDYIENPKDDGYRGYHLIGSFNGSTGDQRTIELQIRTIIQHDWATALEIVDLFTGQALKSNQGKADWKRFFKLVGDHFARMDEIHLFTEKDNREQFYKYEKIVNEEPSYAASGLEIQEYESKLKVKKLLQAFAASLKIADEQISLHKVDGYVLIRVDTSKKEVRSQLFNKSQNELAEKKYIEYEKISVKQPNLVVALVSTTAVGGIKEAYPNYFADSTDFITYLDHILSAPFARKESLLQRLLKGTGL